MCSGAAVRQSGVGDEAARGLEAIDFEQRNDMT